MKFDEVLPLMREGKKARHGRMNKGEYWIGGYASFQGMDKWLTLIRVFDNSFENECYRIASNWASGIENWAIMCDTWELVE